MGNGQVARSEGGEDMAHQRCWKTGQELAVGFFTREIKAPHPAASPPFARLRYAPASSSKVNFGGNHHRGA